MKLLSERYAADEAITERFKREGLAAARLSGESGAVTIFDVGEWEGRPFIVMEYLGGGSLEERLARKELNRRTARLRGSNRRRRRWTRRTGTASCTAT